MVHRTISRVATAALLGGVSVIGLAVPARAAHVLFSTDTALNGKEIAPATEVIVKNGVTQVELGSGVVAAFVDGAQFALRPNGVIDLRGGTVTVVSPTGSPVSVMMPNGVIGAVDGENASASFTVTAKGARGSVLGGKAAVLANGVTHIFPLGGFWSAATGHAPEQVVANAPAAVPGTVRSMREGGIAAAAVNGVPIALGEALAGVGANGDIVAAAQRVEAYDRNPVLTAFPRGDYGLLTAYAAQAAAPFGGAAFNGAGADIVRTYFQFLASGRQPGDFRAAYAQSLLSYLDILRSGALPSGITGATQAQLTAYIAFIGRTDGFGALSTINRSLLDAYLAFLSGGGTPDGFGVRASTLVGTYLDYLRAGGDPATFAAASASVVAQYLAILQSGGIKNQLTAANRALLDAYLASIARSGNGLAFANTAATSLAAFTAYLNGGGFPSQYSATDAASIRAYLETLSATGLFDRVLGSQAKFLRSYLVFLQDGGSGDAFDKLPINVLTAQATALGSYYVFIQNGGTPSSYATLTQAQINDYLKALKDVGLFDALLGANARFLSDYYAYLLQGGSPDLYAGLPNVDLNAYATQVASYVAYLKSGKLPSAYTTLSLQQLRDYLNALSASGKLATLLGGDAAFLASYLAFLQGGGVPDQFTGLPIYTYTAYSTQLAAFIAYLNAGGLPSGYTTLSAAQIRSYLEALQTNGQLVALLGANANFFTTYLAYLQSGGSADGFTGLPIATYTAYSSQLAAFVAYLNGGGLPSGYTALTAAQIRSYLEALQANGQLAALLGANAGFFTSYLAYLQGGGGVDAFTGLPIVTYRSYATALSAFYVFLAGGGRPSAYTVLTAAQIKTYLDALATAGQSTTLLGNNASFFAGYRTYLSGGGNGDQYAALPTTTAPPPTKSAQYTGGFPATGGRVFLAYGDGSLVTTATALVDANGVVTNKPDIAAGTSTAVDIAGDSRVVIGRFANGNVNYANSVVAVPANGGLAYAVLAPMGGSLPTLGSIDYTVLSATQPVLKSGNSAPGVFDAQLKVNFGATTTFAITGKIVLPEIGGTKTYFITTPPEPNRQRISFNDTQSLIFAADISLSGSGAACTLGNCVIAFRGGFAGAIPSERLGLVYGVSDQGNKSATRDSIDGAVIFGAAGTFPVAGAATGAPTGTGLVGTTAGRGDTNFSVDSLVATPDGKLASISYNGQSLLTRGSNVDRDSGGLGGVIGWTRWVGTGGAAERTAPTIRADGGYALIWGTAVTNLPTSGTANYVLAGSTTPVVNDGTQAPGTLKAAALAVAFDTKKVGLEATIAIGGFDFNLKSTGGVAAPSIPLGIKFGQQLDLGSVTGNDCAAKCGATVSGFLAGPAAAYAGVAYAFPFNKAGFTEVSGTIAFRKTQ